VPAQPVDATPSAINLFSKGGVYGATETGEAFREPTDRDLGPLEATFRKEDFSGLILAMKRFAQRITSELPTIREILHHLLLAAVPD
jgi:hypothetical protein